MPANPFDRLADMIERDINTRKESLDELKECGEQLRTLNQRIGVMLGGLVVFGGSQLGIGIAQNQNIQDLPKEIPQVRPQQFVPRKVPQK
jgi:hypothetical protein